MIKLIIEDDEGKTTVVPLIRDEITIGRKEGNTIRLTERNVSRRHAKLLKQNGAVFIEDLNSYNGIKVNGNRIAGRVAVAEGDRIQIGDYVLGLKLEGATVSPLESTLPPLPASAPQTELPTLELSTRTAEALLDTRPEPHPENRPPALPPFEAEGAVAPTETQPRLEVVGRLVCVSTNFPGQEWLLDRPNIVVGRTEDNDVVINHRSISRHHARITEENGHYTITDLQSSNGVRVNGEEYGKVELRRGDLIDLGHVRLRFVAAGEDFVFERDASVVDISKATRPRGGLYVTVLVVALATAGIVVWYLRRGEGLFGVTDSTRPAASDASVQNAAPAPEPGELVASVSRLLASEQWNEAIRVCARLNGEAKAQTEANCGKAQLELKASEQFENAHKASLQNRYLDVLEYHERIPAESVYKNRDLQVVQNAKAQYLAQAFKDLDDLVEQGECEQAEQLAQRIKEIDPADTNAEGVLASCSSAAVSLSKQQPRPNGTKPRPKVRRPPPVVNNKPPQPPQPPQPAAPSPATVSQVKQLVDQAKQAYVDGNHAQASQLARQVLKLDPGNVSAIQVIGASSCSQKDQAHAKWAYDRLPVSPRNLLRTLCVRYGITLQ